MDRQFATPEPIELYVELGSGAIRVQATDTDESSVRITGPRAEDFTVEHRGRHLVVVPPRDRFGLFSSRDSHEVSVRVPTGSGLATKAGSAALEATGTLGSVRAKTGSGEVDVDTADGPAVIDSGSGDVVCGEARQELRVKSGSGDVEIGKVLGSAGISTGSGDVAVGRIAATAVVKTGSGDVVVEHLADDLSLSSGSGSLTVRHVVEGEVQAKTSTGDVRIGIEPGTPVWTDLSSATGRIGSDLPSVGKPAQGQPHVRLRIRTATGDIVLGQAATA